MSAYPPQHSHQSSYQYQQTPSYYGATQQSYQQTETQYYQQQQAGVPQRSTFYCLYDECANQNIGFARKADLQRHVDVRHNRSTLQLVNCVVPGCHRIGDRGFTRKDKMTDHCREVHKMDIQKRQNSRSSQSPQ